MREIKQDFAEAFKKTELFELYRKHQDELFLGVRDNYLSLYYNCDSIAKIKFPYRKSIVYEIDKYYLDGTHYKSGSIEKRYRVSDKDLCDKYEKIKINSISKTSNEKKAQSQLVIQNNSNPDSNWFCIDIEYVKSFKNQVEKDESGYSGRFDIIAVSKSLPHRVALIELKYGGSAIGGKSGVIKHVSDFNDFKQKGFFESHLKMELVSLLRSQQYLDIKVPVEVSDDMFTLEPEFFFITLDNNVKKKNGSTPKQTMAGYLFEHKRWGCNKLSTKDSAEAIVCDVTKKDNKFFATFLFSRDTIDNLHINDVIDGDYDERIIPE